MRVLVAYDSKRGSTVEIAQWIGGELRMAGLDAEVRPAGDVDTVAGYDAVVLGSAVYMGRWRRERATSLRRYVGTPVCCSPAAR